MSIDEFEDDFEDAREHGVDPDAARRGHKMFLQWHDAIQEAFPLALDGDLEHLQPVILGVAGLLGELAGIVWLTANEEDARELLKYAGSISSRKMLMYVEDLKRISREQKQGSPE
jgi:hypothetical protein